MLALSHSCGSECPPSRLAASPRRLPPRLPSLRHAPTRAPLHAGAVSPGVSGRRPRTRPSCWRCLTRVGEWPPPPTRALHAGAVSLVWCVLAAVCSTRAARSPLVACRDARCGNVCTMAAVPWREPTPARSAHLARDRAEARLASAGLLIVANGGAPAAARHIMDAPLGQLPPLPPGRRDFERRMETRIRIE
ncbi:hypothetical protein AB1Y20_013374 [Prymnesium parvum]|uniref:Uncharacterized protein n=1 Tax=Prymnesium parvum TaxID=97485 RepID=A0AB34IGI2_PRYPA